MPLPPPIGDRFGTATCGRPRVQYSRIRFATEATMSGIVQLFLQFSCSHRAVPLRGGLSRMPSPLLLKCRSGLSSRKVYLGQLSRGFSDFLLSQIACLPLF